VRGSRSSCVAFEGLCKLTNYNLFRARHILGLPTNGRGKIVVAKSCAVLLQVTCNVA